MSTPAAPTISSRIAIVPRYAETSQMGRVADHAYLVWFDLARATLLREQGLDYHTFAAQGYKLPVLEVGLTFHHPAFYDDALEVVTTLRGRPKFMIRLDYEVRRADLVLATGFTVQGFVNRELRPVKPPAALLAKLDLVFPKPKIVWPESPV